MQAELWPNCLLRTITASPMVHALIWPSSRGVLGFRCGSAQCIECLLGNRQSACPLSMKHVPSHGASCRRACSLRLHLMCRPKLSR